MWLRNEGTIRKNVEDFFPENLVLGKYRRSDSFKELFGDGSSQSQISEKKFSKRDILNIKSGMVSTKEITPFKGNLRRVGTMFTPFKNREKGSLSKNNLFRYRTFLKKTNKKQNHKEIGFLIKSERQAREKRSRRENIGRLMFKKLNKEENEKLKLKCNELIKSANHVNSEIIKQLQKRKRKEEEEENFREEMKIAHRKKKIALNLMEEYGIEYERKYKKFKENVKRRNENIEMIRKLEGKTRSSRRSTSLNLSVMGKMPKTMIFN